jgi:putative (di)nucleoside polyphosphate hydrolase
MLRTPAPPPGYRPNVGLMLIDRQGRLFLGHRSKSANEAWQMPQGGVDDGETPAVAALRELEEEVGVGPDKVEIAREGVDWLSYDVPPDIARRLWKGKWRGQAQKWFALRFLGDDADVRSDTRHPEFDAWRWAAPAEALDLIVPFKRDVYRVVLAEFADLCG